MKTTQELAEHLGQLAKGKGYVHLVGTNYWAIDSNRKRCTLILPSEIEALVAAQLAVVKGDILTITLPPEPPKKRDRVKVRLPTGVWASAVVVRYSRTQGKYTVQLTETQGAHYSGDEVTALPTEVQRP